MHEKGVESQRSQEVEKNVGLLIATLQWGESTGLFVTRLMIDTKFGISWHDSIGVIRQRLAFL